MAKRYEQQFIEHISNQAEVKFDSSLLHSAIEFIRDNFKPEEVFDDDVLRDYVCKNSLPNDVFLFSELEEWAEANGFVKS